MQGNRFARLAASVCLSLLLALMLTSWASAQTIRVSQESSPGAGDFNANVLGYIEPYTTSGTAAQYFAYGIGFGASFNGPAPDLVSDESQLFLVDSAVDGLTLFIVHDKPQDGSGGQDRVQIDLSSAGADVLVKDDPGEAVVKSNGDKTFSALHTWAPCCTDGYVIGPISDAGFPAYVQFSQRSSYQGGQLETWAAASSAGPSLPLALEEGRQVRLDLVAEVGVDIKPQSCPNPLNTKSKGVLPVAVLGSADLDVSTIDPSTVTLNGVPALRSGIEDVSGPVQGGEDCECTEDGADGYDDLTLKFDKQAVVAALGGANDGDVIALHLVGNTWDGQELRGADCVIVKVKGKGPAKKIVSLRNSPNPFNPSTTIAYTLGEAGNVRLSVYNLLGQEVRVLVDNARAEGSHSVRWDGRDALGREVTSGVYFYRLAIGGEIMIRKMVFAK
jgi:hypothetical protein